MVMALMMASKTAIKMVNDIADRRVGKWLGAAVFGGEMLQFLSATLQAVRLAKCPIFGPVHIAPITGLLSHEGGAEIDLDDAAIFGQRDNHLIAHVALEARRKVTGR